VTLLYVTHDACLGHDAGTHHPERATRLHAARAGLDDSHLDVMVVAADPVDLAAIDAVHEPRVRETLVRLDELGGGVIDPDTSTSPGSWRAAGYAAGSAATAVRLIDGGRATRAFCAVRPPGHHATPHRSMGFCLLNSIAITAAALRDRGERVAIVDLDAHHGNGTQEVFFADRRVLFASIHQWPFYPGSGAVDEVGRGDAAGTTVNVPVPAGATGDVYRDAIDRVIGPALERFDPTWLLLSIGYDAHRDDPLTALGLTSGDYADIIGDVLAVVPDAPVVALLEGGYDLDAVRRGVCATLGAFAGESTHPERPTTGGRGRDAVDAAASLHREGRW
jgi:acetoin utilization deacetylase AcuC-like enzyme